MTSQSIPVYDSDERRLPLAELRHLWEYRSLVRLLVSRELTVRYKRSLLGVWWTLLNPMFQVAVFWIVFSQIFSRDAGGPPFIIYLTAGILMAGFFAQGVNAAGAAIVNNKVILSKVYVPPEVFSFAAAIAAAVNFAISIIPLLIIQFIQGVGIPPQFVFVPISIFAMLLLVSGLGLLVASVAVVYHDVFSLIGVMATLLTYLAATFYPIDIIPEKWQIFINLNPLFHHISVFRAFAYGDGFSMTSFVLIFVTGVLAMALGVWAFSRNWRNVVVAL